MIIVVVVEVRFSKSETTRWRQSSTNSRYFAPTSSVQKNRPGPVQRREETKEPRRRRTNINLTLK